MQLNAPFKFVAITASKSSSDIFTIRLSFCDSGVVHKNIRDGRISLRSHRSFLWIFRITDAALHALRHSAVCCDPFTTSSAFAAEPL